MDEREFLKELAQMVALRATTEHLVDTLAFVSEVAARLEEDPVFGEFTLAEHISQDSRKRQIRLHGFTSLDESDGTMSLVIGRWINDEAPGPLTTEDVVRLRSCLEHFVTAAVGAKPVEQLNPSSEAYALVETLRNRRTDLSCIRLHIFSNQSLSQRFKKGFRSRLADIQTETHIWDLKRLMDVYASGREREMVEIELNEFKSGGIPCIEASKADGLQSYLSVIGGNVLADLFDRYGSRLLEGNVRSFLGMRGNVNKGIRKTIQDVPHLFFAYNNGIAATAADVKVDSSGGVARITGVSDLQIVNGGQTTASVLRARKQDGLSLDGVAIPMKLTVVAREKGHDLIPRIAEYANTQNKVAVADFFANHPFHRKMEEISRRLLVPAKAGVRVQSKWFYERSRGQYQNERLYLTKARKDAFDLEYPSKQVINKTELAKYDSVLDEKPYWAALGIQKNFIKFAGKFSPKGEKTESEYWEELSPKFGEGYYKRIAAMAILWKAGEGIVSDGKGTWYKGDYRPQIVAYAWALVFHAIRSHGREPDISKVWERQRSDESLDKCYRSAAVLAQDSLLVPPAGSSNVGEWAKKEVCWKRISELTPDLGDAVERWSVDKEEDRARGRDDRQQGAQDDGIARQAEIVRLAKIGYWQAMNKWDQLERHVFGTERTLVQRASTIIGVTRITMDRDIRKLLDIKDRCEGEGFRGPS